MKKETTSVRPTGQAAESSGLIAINSGLNDVVAYDKSIVFLKLQEFIRLKNTEAFSLHLPLDSAFNSRLKRSVDILLSSIIIILFLSWLIPLIALLIKLDSRGPVFFLQKRNKRNGRVFTCIKFRSMLVNDEADTEPARVNDKRITRLGRFLRNHFLDELPQFFNVLIGDMSVIGPRPHMISDNLKYEDLIEYYNYRHKVKPGITGLSQVLGFIGAVKNIQSMKDRVQADIFYARHWSFWLDLKILWYTLRRLAGL
jgi:putative colanic acid biosynthesis UDP-glucose lipid carrier transferase